jgi:hypothetical protein
MLISAFSGADWAINIDDHQSDPKAVLQCFLVEI